jgi:hypothetical protein
LTGETFSAVCAAQTSNDDHPVHSFHRQLNGMYAIAHIES